MTREPFRRIESTTVVLPQENIDTDQIIPARFLKEVGRTGLGRWLFADWRYGPDGAPRPAFPLNRPDARDACILVAGDNFGCGSSREHATWALADFGFRVVVSSSIADIFASNALKNGLLPVVVPAALHLRLLDEPGAQVTVDLDTQTIALADGQNARFPVDPFARVCLLRGLDELGFLLSQTDAISGYEEARR